MVREVSPRYGLLGPARAQGGGGHDVGVFGEGTGWSLQEERGQGRAGRSQFLGIWSVPVRRLTLDSPG